MHACPASLSFLPLPPHDLAARRRSPSRPSSFPSPLDSPHQVLPSSLSLLPPRLFSHPSHITATPLFPSPAPRYALSPLPGIVKGSWLCTRPPDQRCPRLAQIRQYLCHRRTLSLSTLERLCQPRVDPFDFLQTGLTRVRFSVHLIASELVLAVSPLSAHPLSRPTLASRLAQTLLRPPSSSQSSLPAHLDPDEYALTSFPLSSDKHARP